MSRFDDLAHQPATLALTAGVVVVLAVLLIYLLGDFVGKSFKWVVVGILLIVAVLFGYYLFNRGDKQARNTTALLSNQGFNDLTRHVHRLFTPKTINNQS